MSGSGTRISITITFFCHVAGKSGLAGCMRWRNWSTYHKPHDNVTFLTSFDQDSKPDNGSRQLAVIDNASSGTNTFLSFLFNSCKELFCIASIHSDQSAVTLRVMTLSIHHIHRKEKCKTSTKKKTNWTSIIHTYIILNHTDNAILIQRSTSIESLLSGSFACQMKIWPVNFLLSPDYKAYVLLAPMPNVTYLPICSVFRVMFIGRVPKILSTFESLKCLSFTLIIQHINAPPQLSNIFCTQENHEQQFHLCYKITICGRINQIHFNESYCSSLY